MDCWQILNISPTNDERAIKRAYAKLLKTTRPDDDAEGYQRLRQAFDDALSIAPYIEDEDEVDDESVDEVISNSPFDKLAAYNSEDAEEIRWSESSTHTLNDFHEFDGVNTISRDDESFQAQSWFEEAHHAKIDHEINSTDNANDVDDIESNNENDVESIMIQLSQWYEEAGSAKLVTLWPEISQLFAQVSLDDGEALSFNCCSFLKEHNIVHPLLWMQWSNYFEWNHNIYNDILSSEEILALENYREVGDLLHCTQILPNSDNPLSDTQEHNSYPVARAFSRFLGHSPSLIKRFFASFCAILMWPEITQETSEKQRAELSFYQPSLSCLFDESNGLKRKFYLITISALITSYFIANPSDYFFALIFDYFILNFVFDKIYLTCIGMIMLLVQSKPLQKVSSDWQKVKSTNTAKIIYLILFPLSIFIAPLIGDDPFPVTVAITIFVILSLNYYLSLYLEAMESWTLAALTLLGLVELMRDHANLQISADYIPYIATITLLWFNANLYLIFDRNRLLEKCDCYIRQTLNFKASFLLLWPFKAVISVVLWLLLIPAHTFQISNKQGNSMLLAIFWIGMFFYILITRMLPWSSPLILYPALLLASLLRYLMIGTILRLFNRAPA
ncbi:MAG: J domain-containing protein [Neisseria sp.]|uniref:J domain-containing protein n=1 Tax=Neisseria sp. TaxID=192066 RepID=UPI0026DB3076|nr:J domain-containing protein [Neisseria sp.]MDO4640726.1 J domain-containing protein [Neisseria sp.]